MMYRMLIAAALILGFELEPLSLWCIAILAAVVYDEHIALKEKTYVQK